MRALALAVAAALSAAAPAAVRAGALDSIRCPGGLVGVGDATIDLLGKCGAPTLREIRAADAYSAVDTVTTRFGLTALLTSERWTYDFGPQQFVMFATVEGGRVVAIHRGDRGYARSEAPPLPIPRATCDPGALRPGQAKLDLLARCGEPVLVELRRESALYETPADRRGSVLVATGALRDVEVWTYDFGPQAFIRFAVIADGVVVRVEDGNRGYAR